MMLGIFLNGIVINVNVYGYIMVGKIGIIEIDFNFNLFGD